MLVYVNVSLDKGEHLLIGILFMLPDRPVSCALFEKIISYIYKQILLHTHGYRIAWMAPKLKWMSSCSNLPLLKPQDSLGRFVKNFLDLQKVDHTIRIAPLNPPAIVLNDML